MINAICLKNAIISGANNISNHKNMVNDMNIFPVPDGDTGTNMSMTINSCLDKLNGDFNDVSTLAATTASAMLRGARGNSGVILSLLFRGFAEGLKDLENAEAKDIVSALGLGVNAAYGAVANPTEGTILTVARVAYEEGLACLESDSTDVESVFASIYQGALQALATTPKLLPVLKKAGVVDAGGQGFCFILEGMLSVIRDGVITETKSSDETYVPGNIKGDEFFTNAAAEFDGKINFTYCTEFIVGKDRKINFSSNKFSKYLESLGDSVVVVDDEEIIKAHVHTEEPGVVLQEALKFGELLTVKIENMREQHRNAVKEANKKDENKKLEPQAPENEFGFVSVAAGDGIVELFKDLGCDNVVTGGQTMNPSTDDIYEAAMATPAKVVFVLPNNKNIILAAEQAAEVIKDRKIIVVPTRTIPQGISAMLAFDPDINYGESSKYMMEAARRVKTGQVTFAARKSDYGGFKINAGDILALEDGKLTHTDKDPVKAAVKLTRTMVNNDTSFITIIYGEDVSDEQAEKCLNNIKSKVSKDIDINLIKGSQPIYYFILSVE